jgi:arsenate reductase
VEIWFNPACSKCRIAKEALDEAGVDYTLRRYLDEPPSEDELRETLTALRLEPWDITRVGEPAAAELGLDGWQRNEQTREKWIAALAGHPQLIQRPIVVTEDGSAWIARDEEGVQAAVTRGLGGGA